MNVVVTGTKTVDEFKNKRDEMEQLAIKCYKHHKKPLGSKWDKGEPVKVWYSVDDNICVQYMNGSCYKYRIYDNYKRVKLE